MQALIIVVIAALLLAGLLYLHRRQVSFAKLVFIALLGGIVYGVILQLMFGATSKVITQAIDWINIVGNGYIALLQMLVIPLIFVSLMGAFTRLQVAQNLKRIATVTLTTLLGTTAVAALLGYASVVMFHLQGADFIGKAVATTDALSSIKDHQAELGDLTLPQQIVSFIPTNVMADFAGTRATSTIGVVIFTLFLGVAYLWVKEQDQASAKLIARGIEALNLLVSRLVKMVLELTPYGVFALITKAAATSNFDSMTRLAIFIVAAYVAAIAMFIVHALLLSVNGINPITYFKKAWPVLLFAFTSRTSGGSLPLNVKTQREALGVDATVANFAASFGLTIGQNGCAGLYPAMVATIIAPTTGVNVLSWQWLLTIIAVVTVASFGVAGVGGGATFTTLIVLGTLHLPVGILGVLIAIDPIVDMIRTALNVNDSMLAGVLTSKNLGTLDKAQLTDATQVVTAEL